MMRAAFVFVLLGAEICSAGELLYNGIQLPDEWPPKVGRLSRTPTPDPEYLTSPPAVIPIDVGRQLFVDDFLIEQTTLTRTYHQAEYFPENPVLKADKPWEHQDQGRILQVFGPVSGVSVFSDGVWLDPSDQLFKMWYRTGMWQYLAFATSKDGIHWDKPSLDIKLGTNIVHEEGRGSSTVWLDQEEKDPARRFKLMFSHSHMTPQQLFFSPDGIHWGPEVARSAPCGDRSTMFRNPFRKVWVFSIRDGEDPQIGRARRYLENRDIVTGIQWKSDKPGWWVGPDNLDPMRPDLKIPPQLYNLDAVGYESLMLGLFSMWRGQPDDRHKPNEIVVGYSRDGFHWTRPVRTALIPVSENYGDWNWSNVQSAGGVCTIVGDRLHFYVMGWSGERGTAKPGHGSIGLAMLRRDGFASMDAKGDGTLTTRPIRFSGKHLFVNLDAREGGLSAEVIDENEKPIEPFTMANCIPTTGDRTLQGVKWRGANDLEILAGRAVRLRFNVRNAQLYSFWVSPDESGASHGYTAAGGPGFTGPTDTVGTEGDKCVPR